MKLQLRPGAVADTNDAYSWYEERRVGLGEEFLFELQTAFDRILETPDSFPVVYRGTRRALLRRFPYAVFFRVIDDRALVLAVFHGRRDPKTWMLRTDA
jgi:plasmid stabilization system protein ParE